MTKFADDGSAEAARQRVAEDREAVERSRAEYAERTKGKPTPTQEENDLAAHGAHILEHEDDGSGPDPFMTRNMEAKPGSGGGYQTRAHTAHTPSTGSRPATPATPATPASRPSARNE